MCVEIDMDHNPRRERGRHIKKKLNQACQYIAYCAIPPSLLTTAMLLVRLLKWRRRMKHKVSWLFSRVLLNRDTIQLLCSGLIFTKSKMLSLSTTHEASTLERIWMDLLLKSRIFQLRKSRNPSGKIAQSSIPRNSVSFTILVFLIRLFQDHFEL